MSLKHPTVARLQAELKVRTAHARRQAYQKPPSLGSREINAAACGKGSPGAPVTMIYD